MNTSHLNFSPIFRFHVLLWMQTEDQNGGVLGLRLLYCHVSSWGSRILILLKLIIVTWVPYSPGACVWQLQLCCRAPLPPVQHKCLVSGQWYCWKWHMCHRVSHTASLSSSCWHCTVSHLYAEDSNSHHYSKVHKLYCIHKHICLFTIIIMSNSCKCMDINGEAFQLTAVIKSYIFYYSHIHCIWTCNEIEENHYPSYV